MAPGKQHVLGLDVAVKNVARVGEIECVRDLRRDPDRLFNRKVALPLQAIPEGLPFDAWRHVIQQSFRFSRVVQRKNVRMDQTGGDLDLA